MDHVTTPEGLELEVLTAGPDDGYPLLYHGGTPSAAVPFPVLDRAVRVAGLRLVTYSRPGYGTSTPRTDLDRAWTIADDVTDAAAVLDALGVGEFVTLGWSGGGPRVLGCAALLPDRCRAAGVLAGAAPYDAEGLDFVAGMGPENVRDFNAAVEGRAALAPFIEEQVAGMAQVTAAEVADSLGQLVDDVDRAATTGEVAEYLAASFRRASLQGPVGLLEDNLVMVRPWGFDLADIAVPVSLWQGSHDLMVPFSHGQWLAAHVPGVRVHLSDDEGHISLWQRIDEVLAELRDLAGLGPSTQGPST
jgi:pimeloyl-ACP methyl ester carboxylesterase